MALFNTNPSVFDESGNMVMDDAQLRNPNELREALIYNELSQMSVSERQECLKSPELKALAEEGIISDEFIDSIKNNDGGFDKTTEITICQLAKDNNDPLWDELLQARMHEREVMNALISSYGDRAEALGEAAHIEYIEKRLPKTLRSKK